MIRGLVFVAALLAVQDGLAAPIAVRADCPASTAHDYYFASGTLSGADKHGDSFERAWYSSHLTVMGEPSLSCGTPGTVYRFTWLRTFHHPVAVRVVEEDGRAVLYAVELDGAGGYKPGKVLRRTQRTLSADEFVGLKQAFADAHLDALPVAGATMGRDGAQWIIETTNGAQGQRVVRWSPQDGAAQDLGLRLLALSGWSFDVIY